LFLRIATNYTTWCSAATDFLAAQGYHLPGDDPLRRCFANSLHWFMLLTDMTKAWMSTTLQHAHEDIIPETSNTQICLSPHAHCGNALIHQFFG
ncbi:hypothetical protein BT96DRAFT_811107, partial [Gymnopus androsaceus JB14]